MDEVQVFEGDGVRPAPTTYDEVVERLRPIFMEDKVFAEDRKSGDRRAAETILKVTGLTRSGLLADRLTKVVYDKTDLTLQECYDLPVERLAAMIGGIIWEDMMPKSKSDELQWRT